MTRVMGAANHADSPAPWPQARVRPSRGPRGPMSRAPSLFAPTWVALALASVNVVAPFVHAQVAGSPDTPSGEAVAVGEDETATNPSADTTEARLAQLGGEHAHWSGQRDTLAQDSARWTALLDNARNRVAAAAAREQTALA